ncbi:hypothetical protein COO60DRAFT_1662012 [Scenedesmus sp. NREL 46B-D3]|nr:hypothetical protein COO60DRAFT_1662012 [Scenedesmus sp. NREL 46B-D3]
MHVAGIAFRLAQHQQQAVVAMAAQLTMALQLQSVAACRQQSQLITRRQLAASFNNPQQLQSFHAHVHSSSRQVVTALGARPVARQSDSVSEDQGQLLQWSFDEQQQQQQQQQQQHRSHVAEQRNMQQGAPAHKQQRLGQGAGRKDSTASAQAFTAAAPAARSSTGNAQRRTRAGQGKPGAYQQQQQHRHQQKAADDDGYAAAQQRVRQLLISADLSNPDAAAAALPDTVNDIVIALQLLATAPKPPGAAAAKQYDAAVQQLAATVVHKFKLLVLRQQQPDQQGQQHVQHQQHINLQAPAPDKPGSSRRVSIELTQQLAEAGPSQRAAAAGQSMQCSLASALAGVPATKLAAATFSLGVLRQYDTQLVPALEQGSLQLMLSSCSSNSSSSSSSTYRSSSTNSSRNPSSGRLEAKAADVEGIKQQQQLGFTPARFNANQLGQLAQGFVYLDHELSPAWQAAFLQVCRGQMQHMKAPQLASIAAFLLRYRLCSSSSSRSSSSSNSSSSSSSLGADSLLAQLSATSRLLNSDSSSSDGSSCAAATVPAAGAGASYAVTLQHPAAAAAAAAGLSKSDMTWQLYSGWSEAYLSAAAQQAHALKPQHMAPLLGAAAGLHQQHLRLHGAGYFQQKQQQQQQQQVLGGGATSASSSKQRRRLAASRVFGDLPATMPVTPHAAALHNPAGHTANSSSGSNRNVWVLQLLLAFQQQLPEMKMQHLAAALPALAQLTVLPWPDDAAELMLLQLRLLLPGASGTDAVTAAAAAACLAPPGVIAADGELRDALLQRLHAVMSTLSPGGLAAAIQTLAVLQIKPYRAWVAELCARLRVEARSMSAVEVLAVLEGLAALRVQLDPEVLHLVVLGVRRGLGVMSRHDLCRTVAALRRMYPRVLPGRTVAQLVEEMGRRAALLELQEAV